MNQNFLPHNNGNGTTLHLSSLCSQLTEEPNSQETEELAEETEEEVKGTVPIEVFVSKGHTKVTCQ